MQKYECINLAVKAKQASILLAKAKPENKNVIFKTLAELLKRNMDFLIAENKKDIQIAKEKNLDAPRIDRLRLDKKIITEMAEACEFVCSLPDPVGEIEQSSIRPNALVVSKMRIPLGVVCMIYEARPNVTIDASILCIKAGNAVVLRGGSEAIHSNIALEKLLHEALEAANFPKECAQLLHNTDRKLITELCKLDKYIDVIIPRGGEELVSLVSAKAKMPVLKHDKGVCHAYIDTSANLARTIEVISNSKCQRPAACNALEAILVHKKISKNFLPQLEKSLNNVELRACPKSIKHLKNATKLTNKDKGQEFHDYILVVIEVSSIDEAINYIHKHGSKHSEIIFTNNLEQANRFKREIDASMVAVNASSRFNDGGQLGLGAEIGISTSKLHAYGAMGIKELTSTKFIVEGEYLTRS